MAEAIERATYPNMFWYSYRRVPAVTLAKQLIDEGRLGKIFHYRAKFLQDWTINPELPQGGAGLWRVDVAAAGRGGPRRRPAPPTHHPPWVHPPPRPPPRPSRTVLPDR